MNRFHKGGLVDDGLSYQFKATSAAGAAHFYFKPMSYFHCMLTDQYGRYLGGHFQYDDSYRYSFHGIGLNKVLRHNYGGIGWYAIGGAYILDI